MSQNRKPPPPKGLGERGRRLWRKVLGVYELEHHERELLAEACRVLDTCAALEETVAADGVTTLGSKGQVRTHPALGELRQQRVLLGRLLAQLDLPDADGQRTAPSPASQRARKAAMERWHGGAA